MNLQSFQAWLLPKKDLSSSSSKFFHGSYCSVVNFRVLKLTFKALHIWTSASLWRFVYVQSCPTLCNLMDCSPPGSSVHGISQARILEWVAIPFSRGSSRPRDQTPVSCLTGRYFTNEPPGKPLWRFIFQQPPLLPRLLSTPGPIQPEMSHLPYIRFPCWVTLH